MQQIFKTKWLLLIVALFTLIPRHASANDESETHVVIYTNKGKLTVKLHNETPQHRDNFIKLAEEGAYKDVLFHRVISQFMIQGGDLESKNADEGDRLGSESGYTIPAEIVFPQYFHRAGALAAARTGDDENPDRSSSGTQFYIVTGKFFTEMELDKMAKEKNLTFTDEQKKAYMLEGGTPHLDNKYTIFGQVIKGLNTAYDIQAEETDENDRPLDDIRIKKMKVIKK